MNNNKNIAVVIPAFNEEKAIGKVIQAIPKEWVNVIVVGNNGSKDNTEQVATAEGAIVVNEPRPGYGYACLKALDFLRNQQPEIVVFLDGDYSDYPEELIQLVNHLEDHQLDLVIGSRKLGQKEKGSMTPQQIFGNWLATTLIRIFYKVTYTDLGPFRAIRWETLEQLKMEDKTYGWTVEMQLKAAKLGLKVGEIPVNYRKRIGQSKVSGTIKGTLLAGYKIITWIFKYL